MPPSVMDPDQQRLTAEYAHALLGAIEDDADAEEVAGQIEALQNVLVGSEGLGELLSLLSLSATGGCGFVERVFSGRVCEVLDRFLHVLAKNGRLVLFGGLAEEFRRQLNIRRQRLPVLIRSAVALDAAQLAAMTQMLAETLGQEVAVRTVVDPALIAGMQVQIGDRVYDSTAAGELDELQVALRRRGRSAQAGEAGEDAPPPATQ